MNQPQFETDYNSALTVLIQWSDRPRRLFPFKQVLKVYNHYLPDTRGCHRKIIAQQLILDLMPTISSTALHYLDKNLHSLI